MAMRKKKPVISLRKKRSYTHLTPKKMLSAIHGSRGLMSEIARRIGCSYSAVTSILHAKTGIGPTWNRVRRAYMEECERIGDRAEAAIYDAIEQRLDIATSARTAIAYAKMKLRKRGFVDETHTVLDGGTNPIQVATTLVPIDELNLPLPIMKMILEKVKKRDAEMVKANPDGDGGVAAILEQTIDDGDE